MASSMRRALLSNLSHSTPTRAVANCSRAHFRTNWSTLSPSLAQGRIPGAQHPISTCAPRRARYVRFEDRPQPQMNDGGSNRNPRHDATTVAGRVLVGLVSLGGLYYVAHLEQVPETGRWRFMDISPKFEAALAEASYEQCMNEFGRRVLPPYHPATVHVRRVAARILEANNLGTLRSAGPRPPKSLETILSGTPDDGETWDPDRASRGGVPGTGQREWNLLVVGDNKVVNAMATPGTMKDWLLFWDTITIEIGHVVARHVAERYSYSKVLIGLGILLQATGVDFGLSGFATTYLLDLPNSRKQELEADTIGLKLSARACFDPRGAPDVYKRLAQLGDSGNLDFLQTHPSSEKRVIRLEDQLPMAYEIRAASPDCSHGEQMHAFGELVGRAW
ncbi:hypothetical protein EVG20_g8641 [Dentipellis fragilis]|uniref:Peptidase M48 domain-containing protein n=1 Tax=Dentipellis fragilis TaxID=205917 RepID=A0A4Y9Y4X2_9AGAM|nr:hypothetical protein EVG20_g8641 [Dentipellis fragilis]